ncbi:MAG: hypothetical protein V1893_02520 [Candidatus Omnitrophota bacterium]
MHRKKKSAFSFVEVLIAAIIVNIVVIGCFGTFLAAKSKVNVTKRRLMALNYAQEKIEELVSLSFDDASLAVDDYNTNTLPNSELKDGFGGTRTYAVAWGPDDYSTGSGERYKIITVTITWTEPQI